MKIEALVTGNGYNLYADNGSFLFQSKRLYEVACVSLMLAHKYPMTQAERLTATTALKTWDANRELKEQEAERRKQDKKDRKKAAKAAQLAALEAMDPKEMDLTIPDPTEEKGAESNE